MHSYLVREKLLLTHLNDDENIKILLIFHIPQKEKKLLKDINECQLKGDK